MESTANSACQSFRHFQCLVLFVDPMPAAIGDAKMSAAALDNGLVRMDGPADPAAVERDLRCMEDIFEEELRRAAFRMADENDAGAISREECRTVLSSLAGGSEARRQAVASAVLPSQVDLEKFLRVASEVLA
eukprot:TRINITY_DN16054_c0_g1_i4.p4 TRINITY_DN16054_c0_g1~~TRINITY_DN16054_c0_g1_i4.p4  ORF type:complete len:133 (+),score=34.17 TRINITY_DN16054_c0_g1_i4:1030-1428(+)